MNDLVARMLPGTVVMCCDEQDTPAHRSNLVTYQGMTRCSKCRMPPVVFDRWGLPWCSTHWEAEKKTHRKQRTKKGQQ